jgi:hypothetical protein
MCLPELKAPAGGSAGHPLGATKQIIKLGHNKRHTDSRRRRRPSFQECVGNGEDRPWTRHVGIVVPMSSPRL